MRKKIPKNPQKSPKIPKNPQKLGIGYQFWTQAVSVIFIVGIILWSALKVLADDMTAGELIAILQMVGLLMASATALATANIQLQEARVAFDRMHEFASIPGEQDRATGAATLSEPPRQFTAQRVSFRYPGRPLLLENIDLHLSRGSFVALMGESGSGKSTLLQILQRFYRPEAGHIRMDSLEAKQLDLTAWRAQLGVVPQQIKIFNGTVLDNVLLGEPPSSPEALESFFQATGLDTFFRALPRGYATIVGEQGVNLSGGQQQILALARALWRKPAFLLLDEPTAALDRKSERLVIDLLQRIKPNTGIMVLTHRLSTARQADRILILEKGKIVASGNHAALLEQENNFYAQAWTNLTGD